MIENEQLVSAIQEAAGSKSVVVYDGDCPFCSSYVAFGRLREARPDITLLDARELAPELLAAIMDEYDLNEGMIVVLDDEIHWGGDAMHVIALVASRPTVLHRLNAFVFRSPVVSRLIYPFLRTGRNLTLWLLGRSKIGT